MHSRGSQFDSNYRSNPMHYGLYLSLRARDTKKAQEINEFILNQVIRDVVQDI